MIRAIRLGVENALSRFSLQVCAVLVLVAAIAGPFGTFDLGGLGVRLAFWTGVVTVSSLLGHVANSIARELCGDDRPILSDAVLVSLNTAAFAPVLWAMVLAMFGAPGVPFASAIFYVATVTAAVAVVRRLLPGLNLRPYFWRRLPQQQPRLARRLPDDFAGEVLRITVRDHFVDVVTTAGTHSIRLRFADAVEETEPLEGFCTHRSHWVARRAVEGVEREDGRISLRLKNGDMVPVSRGFRPALEEAGLI